MKKFLIAFAILTSIIALNKHAYSEKVHGIAMHGTPKYASDFENLDYVNPNAPKGGTVKFGSYGSFDNLNRVAFKGSKAAGLGYVNDTLMRRVWDEAFSLYGLSLIHI